MAAQRLPAMGCNHDPWVGWFAKGRWACVDTVRKLPQHALSSDSHREALKLLKGRCTLELLAVPPQVPLR